MDTKWVSWYSTIIKMILCSVFFFIVVNQYVGEVRLRSSLLDALWAVWPLWKMVAYGMILWLACDVVPDVMRWVLGEELAEENALINAIRAFGGVYIVFMTAITATGWWIYYSGPSLLWSVFVAFMVVSFVLQAIQISERTGIDWLHSVLSWVQQGVVVMVMWYFLVV